MNYYEETASLIAVPPHIREFTNLVLMSIRQKKGLFLPLRQMIHADLVPKISKETIEKSIMNKSISVKNIEQVNFTPMPRIKKFISNPNLTLPSMPNNPPQIKQIIPKNNLSEKEIYFKPVSGYGKIDPLLNDSSISAIECPGPEKPVVIIRMGRRQFTQIILNKDEIIEVLEEIAARVKIPLMEGVFRAAVDNFYINSIVNDMIGSKFVITKNLHFIKY